jgi:hypothetical protein
MAADDADDEAFIRARITAVEAQIVAYEAAVLALGSGVQSYELDTGQTRQRVTKVDLLRLSGILDSLMNRRQTLRALLNGGGTHVIPGF